MTLEPYVRFDRQILPRKPEIANGQGDFIVGLCDFVKIGVIMIVFQDFAGAGRVWPVLPFVGGTGRG